MGLVLLNLAFGRVEERHKCTCLQSITDRLKEIPVHLNHDEFMHSVLALKLNEDELVKEHMVQLSKKPVLGTAA